MKRISLALIILVAIPALAAAQAKPAAGQKLILEFVDGPDLTVTTADKSILKLNGGILEGDEIPSGATITTGQATWAELRLKPNGSIIKLAKSTTFTISALAATPQDKNSFALLAGKIRTVAAKGSQYQFASQTAVCAVRGTDFAFEVEEGSKAALMVSKGQVQFDKLDSGGNVLGSIAVGAGQVADAFASAFTAAKYSEQQFADQYGDLAFKKLSEADVPQGESVAPAQAAAPAPTPAPTPSAAPPAAPAAAPAPAAAASPAAESPLMKWLRDSMGFELGSVTIQDQTYSKAIIQPAFALGNLKLGLYLPVIYSSNLFDPNDWYRPDGNNEWSFGSSQFANGDYLGGAADLGRDLVLKIKYLEYGTQLQDPFFVKIGSLDDMTLGHGLIVGGYANDSDFPAVRRVGLDTGLDLGGGGFELLANDISDPEIAGARLFFRPIKDFKLAIGVSAALDWNAASTLDPGLNIPDAGLWLIGTGLDLDLPIVTGSLFGIRAFADGAVTLPYVRSDFSYMSQTITSGLKTDLVYSDGELKNWGAAGGFIGNVAFIDWRLEFRYFTGDFRPAFFDSTYDQMRGQYAAQYLGYLVSQTAFDSAPTVMGVYGQGGFSLLKDKLSLQFGYMWPWSPDAGLDYQQQLQVLSNDELNAKLVIRKGLIPIVDVAGSISYQRRGLAQSIAKGNFKFLDSNTLFSGEVDVPVPKTPNLDLAVIFQTVPVLNSDGSIDYTASGADKDLGIPALKPSISIETRFHF
jgi:hypothetical protein